MSFSVKGRFGIRFGLTRRVTKCGRDPPQLWRVPPLPERLGTIARELLDGDFGALARSFGDFFYAGVYHFADGFQEFDPRVR